MLTNISWLLYNFRLKLDCWRRGINWKLVIQPIRRVLHQLSSMIRHLLESKAISTMPRVLPILKSLGEENVIRGNKFDFILKSPHSHFNFYSVLVTSLNLQSYCRRIPKINWWQKKSLGLFLQYMYTKMTKLKKQWISLDLRHLLRLLEQYLLRMSKYF